MTSVSTTDFGSWSAGQNSFSADEPNDALIVDPETKNSGRRASTDGGATFADKINLSNSTDAESQDAEIAAEGDNVIITWWERNQTAEEPVVRMSTDNGATFGPLLKLAANGTIGGG